mmetsp:Transcript_5182/g.12884  ORF Transcript_5182/g.12884 Transcript_5182/m.12884 type:complete len:210 (-) Transcript_5182:795-1424(-)
MVPPLPFGRHKVHNGSFFWQSKTWRCGFGNPVTNVVKLPWLKVMVTSLWKAGWQSFSNTLAPVFRPWGAAVTTSVFGPVSICSTAIVRVVWTLPAVPWGQPTLFSTILCPWSNQISDKVDSSTISIRNTPLLFPSVFLLDNMSRKALGFTFEKEISSSSCSSWGATVCTTVKRPGSILLTATVVDQVTDPSTPGGTSWEAMWWPSPSMT